MRTRKTLAVVTSALSMAALHATPALAYMNDAGEETGEGMSVLQTLTWFVIAPAVAIGVLTFLWALPKWRRDSMPSTGDNWDPKP